MKKHIVTAAAENASFNSLVATVKATGLIDSLIGDDPFTVFASTDKAFTKLPEGNIGMLLKPENKDHLAALLTYHLAPGTVNAAIS